MTPAQLVEIEEIKRLKFAYFRCLHLKRWDEIRELFTKDATCAYSAGAYAYEGRDAIVDCSRKAVGRGTFLSSHKAHHPEIELTGARRCFVTVHPGSSSRISRSRCSATRERVPSSKSAMA